MKMPSKRKNLIINRHASLEYSNGILGPQAAATAISNYTNDLCKVYAFNPKEPQVYEMLTAIKEEYKPSETNIGIGGLCCYDKEYYELIRELRNEGYLVYLGGPEAMPNYLGEPDVNINPHRFKGWKKLFEFAVQGDVAYLFPFIDQLNSGIKTSNYPSGILHANHAHNTPKLSIFNIGSILNVDWNNLWALDNEIFSPIGQIKYGQVLGQVGCPYTKFKSKMPIPTFGKMSLVEKTTKLYAEGCSFCSVAVDKGKQKHFTIEQVVKQIENLPDADGKKIYFEYIDELPFPTLKNVFPILKEKQIKLDGVRILTRADWFIQSEKVIRKVLEEARAVDTKITLFCMGFESFDEKVLRGLTKGTTVEDNLKAIDLMRKLKQDFPDNWSYSPQDKYTKHGYIAPTPWHTTETLQEELELMKREGLFEDVYGREAHNVLEIHHATGLGNMIRSLEDEHGLRFNRNGLLIEWADKHSGFESMIHILSDFNQKLGLKGEDLYNMPIYNDSGKLMEVHG